ncbi:tyrosine-type recombinase/integrase [Paenibacillus xylaniclasticus]|uniref:tyrosine-type recombinase/integrase n=1 Tax=Paenibacillus xylaniclasticus TaxID=588083 RepID=UPI0013E0AB43|nr:MULTISPECIES: site-specific integrase [Paenibacillus]GFN32567.1 hypothetical protein PCURB6_28270 [Paenibacillus curdlanolyticus]
MNTNLAKVRDIGINNVESDIMTILDTYESKRTKVEYLKSIEEFFMYFHGKALNQLTKADIETVNNEKLNLKHAEKYQNYLKGRCKPSTVNKKMYAIKAIYERLQGYGYDINSMAFKVTPLKVKHNKYGILDVEQMKQMAELALGEKYYPEKKRAFILLAAVTSIRVNALLSITKADIRFSRKPGLYIVRTIDKDGELVEAPFEKELYDILMQFVVDKDERIFEGLTADSVLDCVKRLAQKMGIPDSEHITTHSLRKTAPVFELNESGSLDRAQKQTRHKSLQVLKDHYTDNTPNYANLAGIRMMKKLDESVLELVSKEEALKMLKELNISAYNQLVRHIQEIIGL